MNGRYRSIGIAFGIALGTASVLLGPLAGVRVGAGTAAPAGPSPAAPPPAGAPLPGQGAGQGASPAAAATRTSPAPNPPQPSSTKPSAVTALVLAAGEQRGSAVSLQAARGGTWLVTNRHVVDGERNVCVRSADGRLWPAVTVRPRQVDGLDVAFLWLPAADSLPIATPLPIPSGTAAPWGFPIVVAAGYPVQEGRQAQPPAYQELRGLLLPALPRPLEGGMQLATTAPVRKGMSGGGLFDHQGRLIGLNTTHADPLWPAPLQEETGKPVPAALNRQLELVALAIPIQRILPWLQTLLPPGTSAADARLAGATGGRPSPAMPGRAEGNQGSIATICNGYLW